MDFRELLTRALRKIDELEAKLAAGQPREPIAIIGLACRFPGGTTAEEFFQSLLDGRDAVRPISSDRWGQVGGTAQDPPKRWAGLLDPATAAQSTGSSIADFDPAFFGISPREAARMDPQQRLLLEVCYEALEDAGISPERLLGSACGTFIGMAAHDYKELVDRLPLSALDHAAVLGSVASIAAGRIAHTLGLRGPALTIDTACSSSLVAVHLGAHSLWSHESDVVLAGGVNILLSARMFEATRVTQGLAPDGKCKTFDALANGFVRGEGCGVVVLKRLSDARRDGDRPWALLRASAVNHDGQSAGLAVPSGPAQESLLRTALERARLAPGEVGFIETFGAGSAIGDAIEATSLKSVYGTPRPDGSRCYLGAVKSNIGHLEAAAGVAGLIKAVLAVHKGVIPRNLHFRHLNPRIEQLGPSLAIPVDSVEWTAPSGRRIAGISSFGASGTNAHLLIEEPPPEVAAAATSTAQLLTLSGAVPAAVRDAARRLHAFWTDRPLLRLRDVAYTLACRRQHLHHRLAIVASSREAALLALQGAAEGMEPALSASGRAGAAPELAFLFSGDSSALAAGVGRTLYASFPPFRDALDACASKLTEVLERPLLDVLFAAVGSPEAELLTRPLWTQVAGFTIEYALAGLWRGLGVEPTLLLGHGGGELAAACIAGVFSLSDALRLVAARGRLQQALPGSAGAAAEAMRGELHRVAATISYHAPTIPIVSSGSGRLTPDELAGSAYWVGQLDAAGRTGAAVGVAIRAGHAAGMHALVELGPTPALSDLARAHLPMDSELQVLPSLTPGQREDEALLWSLARLHVRGGAVDLGKLHQPPGQVLRLPSYPFQRSRYWLDVPTDSQSSAAALAEVSLLGQPPRPAEQPRAWQWQQSLSTQSPPWLADHRVVSRALLPTAAYITFALAAARQVLDTYRLELRELELREAVVLRGEPTLLAVTLGQALTPEPHLRLQISSAQATPLLSAQSRQTHAVATVWLLLDGSSAGGGTAAALSLSAARQRCSARHELSTVYSELRERGLEYGPAFAGLTELYSGGGEALGRVQLPVELRDASSGPIHPALLEACFQAMAATGIGDQPAAWQPVAIGRVRLYRPAAGELWCHAVARPHAIRRPGWTVSFVLWDLHGERIAELDDMEVQPIAGGLPERSPLDALLQLHWEQASEPVTDPRSASGRWLLLADRRGVAARLASGLRSAGAAVASWPGGSAASDLAQAVAGALAGVPAAPPLRAIVLLRGLDDEPVQQLSSDPSAEIGTRGYHDALMVAQALATRPMAQPLRVYLVTERAVAALTSDRPQPAQALAYGLVAALRSEHPGLECCRLDLGDADSAEETAAVVRELLAETAADPVALRGTRRLLGTLRPAHQVQARGEVRTPAQGRTYALTHDAPGRLDTLTLRLGERRPPLADEVELEVRAAGVNFADVMVALGMLPTPRTAAPAPPGSECVGRVLTVGAEVRHVQPGDTVLCAAPGCFRSHLTAPASRVWRAPQGRSAEALATMLFAPATAYYGLAQVAGLRAGEKVLIHAAAGGVGLAAVQWARHVGAEIYATAGSEYKRRFLREQGVRYVSDSRSDQFAADIDKWTAGRGVDVVLNTLSGRLLYRSLEVLADFGRFVDLTKRDHVEEHSLPLAPFLRGLNYSLVDLKRLSEQQPQRFASLIDQVLALFAQEVLVPPVIEAFPITRAEEAFRRLSHDQHLGKVVLSLADCDPQVEGASPKLARAAASYLVTEALSPLGLATARLLADAGAGHLILAGKTSEQTAAQAELIASLRKQGVLVTVTELDVTDGSSVERLLAEVPAAFPLRGVSFIPATATDDGQPAHQLSPERFGRRISATVLGAWQLHRLTVEQPLDFFFLYSSLAVHLGAPGRGHDAAAGAFLDALAHMRRGLGLAATAIDWRETPMEAASLLGHILTHQPVQVAVAELRLATLDARLPHLRKWSLWRELYRRAPQDVRDRMPRDAVRHAQGAERTRLLEALILSHLQGVLHLTDAQVAALEKGQGEGEALPFVRLGLDSLLALELKVRLQDDLGIQLQTGSSLGEMTLARSVVLLDHALLEAAHAGSAAGNSLAGYEEGDL